MIFKTPTCTPAGLDCVAGLEVPPAQCLESCEGPVVDAGRLQSQREALAEIISDYENFKYPPNLTYPTTMKGM